MKDIQGEVFSDFEAPTTTDGSFAGRQKVAKATQKHLQMKLEQEIVEVNQRLKISKTKVSIHSRKGTIQLRATLPLKPRDVHPKGKQRKQYTISLGIPASFDGLKTAEEEAQELGKLIARQTFTWTDKYLGIKAYKKESITFREFYEQFESFYFSTRKRTLKSESTYQGVIRCYRRHFLQDVPINSENLVNCILTSKTPYTREHAIKLGYIIAKKFNLKTDFKVLKLKIEKNKRNIPSDKDITMGYLCFDLHLQKIKAVKPKSIKSNKIYKLIYGLIAVYGLRPREIMNQPDLNWLVSSENENSTFKVHESNKTGYREVFPFVSEWIELFDIKNQENINLLKDYVDRLITPSALAGMVTNLSKFFANIGLQFTPYDLRHACAIRAHLQGVPIKAASDNLGHSVDIHTKVYQRWFGLENRRKAFQQTVDNNNEVDNLKKEVLCLKKRITELETELARYQLKKMM
ncbi:MAG: site-specific integrase [Rivularia sp. ALOHA_DT_140]|nr:site-specific integrase [Rivularia sp. ALOHA_DT_140]